MHRGTDIANDLASNFRVLLFRKQCTLKYTYARFRIYMVYRGARNFWLKKLRAVFPRGTHERGEERKKEEKS